MSDFFTSLHFFYSPFLNPLLVFLKTLSQSLEHRKMSDPLLFARRISKLFVSLGDYESAQALAKKFQLKEAL